MSLCLNELLAFHARTKCAFHVQAHMHVFTEDMKTGIEIQVHLPKCAEMFSILRGI